MNIIMMIKTLMMMMMMIITTAPKVMVMISLIDKAGTSRYQLFHHAYSHG